MRQGEVLSILFEDCLTNKATVWGKLAKSGRSRTVPLTARAQGIIARRFKAAGGDSEARRKAVFDGLNRWSVAHYWDRLSSTMKLQDDRDFVPHILRHEFCSRLADRGLNAAVIKELAGHSSLVVTQRYIRVGAQALVDAIASLEKSEAPQNAAWQAERGEHSELNA
ncbi:site-specific integrase [Bosea minatitlanensis]